MYAGKTCCNNDVYIYMFSTMPGVCVRAPRGKESTTIRAARRRRRFIEAPRSPRCAPPINCYVPLL